MGFYFIKKYLIFFPSALLSIFFFFGNVAVFCFHLYFSYPDTCVNSTSKVSSVCEHCCFFSICIINEGAKSDWIEHEPGATSSFEQMILKKIILFIYGCAAGSLLLRGLFSSCEQGVSAAAACGLLIAVASLAAGHGLWGAQASAVAAHGLNSCGSQALEHRLSSCGSQAELFRGMGIFLGQESNPCVLYCHVDSLSHGVTREVQMIFSGL